MIGGDAKSHVPPASRAETAGASPLGAARPSAAAGAPIPATRRPHHTLLCRHRAKLELSAFQNAITSDLLAQRTLLWGPVAAPLSP
jgi:hypothetical protein